MRLNQSHCKKKRKNNDINEEKKAVTCAQFVSIASNFIGEIIYARPKTVNMTSSNDHDSRCQESWIEKTTGWKYIVRRDGESEIDKDWVPQKKKKMKAFQLIVRVYANWKWKICTANVNAHKMDWKSNGNANKVKWVRIELKHMQSWHTRTHPLHTVNENNTANTRKEKPLIFKESTCISFQSDNHWLTLQRSLKLMSKYGIVCIKTTNREEKRKEK